MAVLCRKRTTAGGSVLVQRFGEVVRGDAVPVVGDLGVAVRLRTAVGTEVHKDDFLDREDALPCDHVPDFGAHG